MGGAKTNGPSTAARGATHGWRENDLTARGSPASAAPQKRSAAARAGSCPQKTHSAGARRGRTSSPTRAFADLASASDPASASCSTQPIKCAALERVVSTA